MHPSLPYIVIVIVATMWTISGLIALYGRITRPNRARREATQAPAVRTEGSR